MGSTNLVDDEHFVVVEGYPNYSVSNFGTVINTKTNRELKKSLSGAGQLRVSLFRNGQAHSFHVSKLVAKAFFVDYDETMAVDQINGDPTECTVMNLTLRPIIRRTKRIRIINDTESIVFSSLKEAAEYIGGKSSLISRAVNTGPSATHCGYRFEFV